MADIHPKLCARPKPHRGLRRPKLENPVLGVMEYINRDGGWWQGTAAIAGSLVRVDFQKGAKVTEEEFSAAAEMLQWIKNNESKLREYVEKQLSIGDFRSNVENQSETQRSIDDPTVIRRLHPSTVILWDGSADLSYDCDSLPERNLFGANLVEVHIEDRSPKSLYLMKWDFRGSAEILHGRPLPPDARDFEDSIADQFIAKAAARYGLLQLDDELKKMLEREIEHIETRIRNASPESAAYLSSARRLLLEIARQPPTAMEHISVELVVKNEMGKRLPRSAFLDRVAIEPGDRAAKVKDTGFPKFNLFSCGVVSTSKPLTASPDHKVHPPEAILDALQDEFSQSGVWLAKQSPEVFKQLRDEGFQTVVQINIWALLSATLTLDLPPKFSYECGRLGLTLSTLILNTSGDDCDS